MKTLLMTLAFTMSFELAMAGTEKGNGGDVVTCNGKLQTLDSAIMEHSEHFKLVREKKYEAKLNAIIGKFKMTIPSYGKKLESFFEDYLTKGNLRNGIIWVQGIPKDVNDENLFVEIPEACHSLKQSVVRVGRDDEANRNLTRYYFNRAIIEQLKSNRDELSWQLVHEWLRDFITNSEKIRLINAYLHSNEFLDASETEVKDSLTILGIEAYREKLYSEVKFYDEKKAELQMFVDNELNTLKKEIEKNDRLVEGYMKYNACTHLSELVSKIEDETRNKLTRLFLTIEQMTEKTIADARKNGISEDDCFDFSSGEFKFTCFKLINESEYNARKKVLKFMESEIKSYCPKK